MEERCWRSPCDNTPNSVVQLYRTTVPHGRTALAQPRGTSARQTDINQIQGPSLAAPRGGRRRSGLRVGRPLHPPRGAPRGAHPAMRVTQSVLSAAARGLMCPVWPCRPDRAPCALAKGRTRAPAARTAPRCPHRRASPPSAGGRRGAAGVLPTPGLRRPGPLSPLTGPLSVAAPPL